MSTIILNTANAGKQSEITETNNQLSHVTKIYFQEKNIHLNFIQTESFEQLHETLLKVKDVIMVFTNCPPDGTYVNDKTYKVEGIFLTTPADGYSKSKLEIRRITDNHPDISIFVITGAPTSVISNHELLELSHTNKVYVKRKRDFMSHPNGFYEGWASFLIEQISKLVVGETRTLSWIQNQVSIAKTLQFGSIRVLFLVKDYNIGKAFAESVRNAFDRVDPIFQFIPINSIEAAHEFLLNEAFEFILAFSDYDYWAPILEESDIAHSPFGRICIVHSNQNVKGHQNLEFWSLEEKSLGVEEIIESLLKILQQKRDQLFGDQPIKQIQGRFLEYLDNFSDYKAYRWLTVNHYDFLNSINAEKDELRLFIPVGSVSDMKDMIRKTIFCADRIIFTFTPVSESNISAGTEISIMRLWDLIRTPLGSTIETSFNPLIYEFRKFFESGKILFYPTPYLVGVNNQNAQQILPNALEILKERPDLPIWRMNNGYEHYTSAEKFEANHVIIDEYKQLSSIGQTLTSIELPYIDNIDANTLYSVSEDYHESYSKFKTQFQSIIEEVINTEEDLHRELIKKRFIKEIKSNVDELNSEFKVFKKSNALQQMGALFLTGFGTLATISSFDISTTLTALIGGGGTGAMLTQYINYLMQLKQKKKSPYSIFWKLSTKSTRPKK